MLIPDIKLPEEAGPKYSLMKEIKRCPFYKKSDTDYNSRKYITDNINPQKMGNAAVPGQLIMFEYFEPKTKEELEYYDALPCTIFFNVFEAKGGKRILGFNIHYYPPKMRQLVMDKIFEMYKPVYSKYFKEPLTKEMDAFDYKYLMEALKKAKLDFGVREYIPELCGRTWAIPANMWQIAVFTEGHFQKRTREAIMKYWRDWKSGYHNKKSKKSDQGENKQNWFQRMLSMFRKKRK